MTETKEPVELEIYSGKKGLTKTKREYWTYETSLGKINVFDSELAVIINDNCLGKKVMADITENGQYRNIKKILSVLGNVNRDKPGEGIDKNARLRRITDCVLAAHSAFIEGKISKEEVATHAKTLYNLIVELDNN